MNLTSYIPTIAKAVAAFLAPLILALVAWAIERTGVNIPVDPVQVETFIVAAFTAIAVWLTSNRPPEPGTPGNDTGQSFVQVLYVVALIVVIIVGAVWLLNNT